MTTIVKQCKTFVKKTLDWKEAGAVKTIHGWYLSKATPYLPPTFPKAMKNNRENSNFIDNFFLCFLFLLNA